MNTTLKTYQKIATEYARRRKGSRMWAPQYAIFKKYLKGKKVLDVGCGTAHEGAWFVRDKFDYLGIDASSGMIKVAKKLVPKGKFKVMDMLSLKLPAKSFDGFWVCASLLHIPKKQLGKVLRRLHKILKDDGIGFITLKHHPRAWEGSHTGIRYGKLKRFFSYHTEEGFRNILKANGFRVVRFMTKINHRDPTKQRWLIFYIKKLNGTQT